MSLGQTSEADEFNPVEEFADVVEKGEKLIHSTSLLKTKLAGTPLGDAMAVLNTAFVGAMHMDDDVKNDMSPSGATDLNADGPHLALIANRTVCNALLPLALTVGAACQV